MTAPTESSRRESATIYSDAVVTKAREIRRRTSPDLSISKSSYVNNSVGLDLQPAEFYDIEEVGCGFGGVVYKSVHLPSGRIMARKLIHNRISSAKIRKSLAAELATLQKCNSPNIVRCFGAFVSDLQVSIALEYVDLGSLDWICRKIGPIPELYLAAITNSILDGLIYLHKGWNIIHRDLKPSNVLLNSMGEVKLCDFGESIELVNSLAKSIVGTTGYMAPERICGKIYSIKSDVWSLGISLIELATGRFPYNLPSELRSSIKPIKDMDPVLNGEDLKLSLIELWEVITSEPSPRLCRNSFTPDFVDFVQRCLLKNEAERPDPYMLKVHI